MESENTNSSDNKLIGKIHMPSEVIALTAYYKEKSKRLEIENARLEIIEAFERWERIEIPINKVYLKNIPPNLVQKELKEMGYNINARQSGDFIISW